MSDEAVIVAREALLLDPAMIEAIPAAIRPAPILIGSGAADTVKTILGRLEDALERREERVGRAAPRPGDMASLRAALGMSIAA